MLRVSSKAFNLFFKLEKSDLQEDGKYSAVSSVATSYLWNKGNLCELVRKDCILSESLETFFET